MYDTAAGAAGAATGCTEFKDTIWEFVTTTGLQFYEPDRISDPRLSDDECLYSAKEMVASSGEPPVLLSFIGFRQSNLLVVVGLMSLEDTLDYSDVIYLAGVQSDLLAQAGATSAPRQPAALQGQPAIPRRRTRSTRIWRPMTSITSATATTPIQILTSAATARRSTRIAAARRCTSAG